MEDYTKEIENLKKEVEKLKKSAPKDKLSLIVFSGSLDKIIAAFVLATGAAAMGSEVMMFFTFWGTPALRASNKKISREGFMSKMFSFMLPKGMKQLKLSQMHIAGLGSAMIKRLMKKKKIASLEEMLSVAEEMEIKIYICEMSMDLMGLKREEMIDYKYLDFAGVAKFLEEADNSKTNLFI